MSGRLFALAYRLLAPSVTRASLDQRRRLVEGLSGAVLEIGCGPGNNFPLYPRDARVTAIDVNDYLLEAARAAAGRARATIEVRHASVEALPFPDAAFDHVVGTLVLCSVEQPAALAEVRRVLRPGGSLRLWEHVVSRRASTRRLQTLASPAWSALAAGCRLDRDTESAIRAAGFVIERLERHHYRTQPAHVLVIARRAPDAPRGVEAA